MLRIPAFRSLIISNDPSTICASTLPRNMQETTKDLQLTRLYTPLCIPNHLHHPPILLQPTRKPILLFPQLTQNHPQLVANVADGLIPGRFPPIAQLTRDADPFAGSGLVGADGVVFGFDELVQLLGEFGLLDAAQRGHGEAVFGRGFVGGGGGGVGARADGEGAIPGGRGERVS